MTGATGFIGLELTRQLHAAGVPVLATVGPLQNHLEHQRLNALRALEIPMLDMDLRRDRPFKAAPSDWNTLFHLAAYVQTERHSAEVRINDQGTRRLLSQLPLEGRHVVYSSTLAVADNSPDGRVEAGTPCRPRTDYGRTKLAAEQIVKEFCSSAGASFTIVRLPTVYGRGFRPGGVFDVLPRRLERGDLLARLAWPGRLALLSVHDAARMLQRVAEVTETRNRVFVASSNENPPLWEISAAIADARGFRYRPVPLPASAVSLLKRLLGSWWQSSTLPHAVQITAWRGRLLLAGLYCDDMELPRLLGMTFRDWRSEVTKLYADPDHAS